MRLWCDLKYSLPPHLTPKFWSPRCMLRTTHPLMVLQTGPPCSVVFESCSHTIQLVHPSFTVDRVEFLMSTHLLTITGDTEESQYRWNCGRSHSELTSFSPHGRSQCIISLWSTPDSITIICQNVGVVLAQRKQIKVTFYYLILLSMCYSTQRHLLFYKGKYFYSVYIHTMDVTSIALEMFTTRRSPPYHLKNWFFNISYHCRVFSD